MPAKEILIADDNQALNEVISMELRRHGYAVHDVVNGQQTIRNLDKARPDLLLLDLQMPVLDGFAVLEHIKQKRYKVPVIILTNFANSANVERCKQLGFTDYYVKCEMDEKSLLKAVEKLIGPSV